MVRVQILVRDGASRFGVSVQARSIHQAIRIAAARYPEADVRVSFPIDAGTFFVEEPGAPVERLRRGEPEREAA